MHVLNLATFTSNFGYQKSVLQMYSYKMGRDKDITAKNLQSSLHTVKTDYLTEILLKITKIQIEFLKPIKRSIKHYKSKRLCNEEKYEKYIIL